MEIFVTQGGGIKALLIAASLQASHFCVIRTDRYFIFGKILHLQLADTISYRFVSKRRRTHGIFFEEKLLYERQAVLKMKFSLPHLDVVMLIVVPLYS